MPSRSQNHKEHHQGVRSDGRTQAVTVPNPLVDQTSTSAVPDSYQFAANSFLTVYGVLRYQAHSVVGGVPGPLVAGITFNEATRTLNWTKTTGTYIVRITATNENGVSAFDDYSIVVT